MRKLIQTFLLLPALLLVWEITPAIKIIETGGPSFQRISENSPLPLQIQTEGELEEEEEETGNEESPLLFALSGQLKVSLSQSGQRINHLPGLPLSPIKKTSPSLRAPPAPF
ncbi:MAG: hypothetical protein PQJ59_00185 [Spirochaetales bacterium]|nr:hypothetical protein [Spirochaetales bacterium]